MHELYCTNNFLLFTCNFIFHLCNYITYKVLLEEKRWKSTCYLRNKYLRAEKVFFFHIVLDLRGGVIHIRHGIFPRVH